jgi:hypothetical protein
MSWLDLAPAGDGAAAEAAELDYRYRADARSSSPAMEPPPELPSHSQHGCYLVSANQKLQL